jgi:hypothetical protein
MEIKMVKSTTPKIRVFGTKGGGVLVTGASAAEVRKALFTKKARVKGAARQELRTALKLHRVLAKFFKSGGRFKRPYKKKSVAKATA